MKTSTVAVDERSYQIGLRFIYIYIHIYIYILVFTYILMFTSLFEKFTDIKPTDSCGWGVGDGGGVGGNLETMGRLINPERTSFLVSGSYTL